jgi:hypothetical protein
MDPLVNGAELHVNRITLKQMNNGEEKRKATCVPGDLAELRQLLEKVYKERGFDFREYRVSTLSRRISRRMRARGADGFSSYAQVLDEDPNEYIAFFNDLTINVTSFFRDEIAFNSLKKKGVTPDPCEETETGEKRAHMECCLFDSRSTSTQGPYPALVFLFSCPLNSIMPLLWARKMAK